MKVENKQGRSFTVDDLMTGVVFECDDELFIKLSDPLGFYKGPHLPCVRVELGGALILSGLKPGAPVDAYYKDAKLVLGDPNNKVVEEETRS